MWEDYSFSISVHGIRAYQRGLRLPSENFVSSFTLLHSSTWEISQLLHTFHNNNNNNKKNVWAFLCFISMWRTIVHFKLTALNYLLWETEALSLIESQDLLGFITWKTTAPAQEIDSLDGSGKKTPNPKCVEWTRTDSLVKSWITGTLSEEVLGLIVGFTTAAAVWSALANAFWQDSQAREFELYSENFNIWRKVHLPYLNI